MRRIAARETEVTSFMTTDYVLDEAVTLMLSSGNNAGDSADLTVAFVFASLLPLDATSH